MARERKKTSASQYLVWGLLGLLAFSLIGFGTGGFGGSAGTIATVAGRDVEAREYGRALRDELRALSQRSGQAVTLDQARQLGVPQGVLGRLIATAALDAEAARLGLSVSDERVAREILAIPAFAAADGFDRAAYERALEDLGMTVAEFEDDVRRELARGILTEAVTQAPAAGGYAEILAAYVGEARDLSWALVPDALLQAGVAEPTEGELTQWYLANEERFRVPPSKSLTVFQLSPEEVAREVGADEDAVRALYDAEIDAYRRPERRIVERLVFEDRDAAEAAAARIEGGARFEDVVEDRGLTLADIDLGDVTEAELGPAGEAVFALPGPGTTGVVEGDLGPAIFRVNAVLDAVDVPFEEARAELAPRAARAAALAEIDDRRGPLDDLLAGGATLEELAEEAGGTLRQVEWTGAEEGGIAADPAFAAAAEAAREGDFPELAALEDGGLFALRVDAERESRVPTLEEVEREARAVLREERRTEALAERAAALAAALEAGEAPEGVDLRTASGVTRDAEVEGAPAGLVSAAFEAEAGEAGVHAAGGEVAIWRVDAVTPADEAGPRAALIREAAAAQGRADMARDMLDLYARAMQNRAEVQIDGAAIAAVEAQFP